jgi:serine/threonine protein kinase
MTLDRGTKLGPYEVLAPIGAGGMGEVYKARDTRLDRTVAIKVSKEKFSERFEREARSIAALNHPHICQLYDVGPDYLVMEYIDGAPLKGPLPLDQAMKYAGQICEALDAAHKKGITHRDLKPANIMVTKAGVKLLDFGLARIAAGAGDETVTMAVMGTPAYMSPEQWEGKPGDARSDIYAFGCVLYEMLTGKRVAQDRAPVEPLHVESVIRKCLEKIPRSDGNRLGTSGRYWRCPRQHSPRLRAPGGGSQLQPPRPFLPPPVGSPRCVHQPPLQTVVTGCPSCRPKARASALVRPLVDSRCRPTAGHWPSSGRRKEPPTSGCGRSIAMCRGGSKEPIKRME